MLEEGNFVKYTKEGFNQSERDLPRMSSLLLSMRLDSVSTFPLLPASKEPL